MTPELQAIFTTVLQALLSFVLALVGYLAMVVTRWIASKVSELKAKIGADKMAIIDEFVQLAVKAAEQLGITQQIQDRASEKRQWVINQVQKFANERGIQVKVEEIVVMLEAALRDGIHRGGEFTIEVAKSDNDSDIGTLPSRK